MTNPKSTVEETVSINNLVEKENQKVKGYAMCEFEKIPNYRSADGCFNCKYYEGEQWFIPSLCHKHKVKGVNIATICDSYIKK